jgi:glycosyltransferase involved in cell wall biosynthesis
MRIGFFTDSYRPNMNGVVVSIETFAAEVARLGSSVVVFAPRTEISGFLTQRILSSTSSLPPGIEAIHWVPSFPLITERSHGLALPIARRVRQLAEELRLDVVHTHTPFAIGYVGVQTGRALGLPLIHTYHTLYAEYSHYLKAGAPIARRITPAYSRWFCNLHDRVLAPSHDIHDLLVGYGVRRPIEVLMTGVPIPPPAAAGERDIARARLGLSGTASVLLFAGRIAREKNLDLLLAALEILRRRRPEVELVIAGDGPDRARTEDLARELGLTRRVRFLGWIPHHEIESCYRVADVFVSASVTETQGLALLEAMASGAPVVAARGPGVGDLIETGTNGLLVEPAAAPFAAAIEHILLDPELGRRLGTAARRRAESVDAGHQARILVERYAELRSGARRERRGLRGLAARAREEVAAWR